MPQLKLRLGLRLRLTNICKDILLYTVLPETELRVETNWVLQNIADSREIGLEDSVRVRLVEKKAEEDMSRVRMERMKKKAARELKWAEKMEHVKFEKVVKNMNELALYDRDEHLQLEEMMSKLGLEDDTQDAGSWEVEEEWLVTWLEVQDRLGLGPDDGDVLMVNIDMGGREMIPEGMEDMEWEEEANPYMRWLEAELMEMDVDRNTLTW